VAAHRVESPDGIVPSRASSAQIAPPARYGGPTEADDPAASRQQDFTMPIYAPDGVSATLKGFRSKTKPPLQTYRSRSAKRNTLRETYA